MVEQIASKAPNVLEELQRKGFTGCLVKVKIVIPSGATQADTLSVPDAIRVWGRFARIGNVLAAEILEASGIEAIERRADIVFGIQRTEEEYNQRFAVRVDLKDVKRKMFTSAIAHWQHKRGTYGVREDYREAHDHINLGLQNLKSRDVKSANNLPKSALIRDYFEVEVLLNYSSISQIAANYLNSGKASNPLDAVDMAFDCFRPPAYVAKPCQLVENINTVGRKLNKMKKLAC